MTYWLLPLIYLIKYQYFMTNILLTGGAGYIGAHMTKMLKANGFGVVVIDNLSTGCRDNVLTDLFYEGDISDQKLVNQILEDFKIDAVMHFAATTDIAGSYSSPQKYYENNFKNTQKFLDTLLSQNVHKFIFSSTCAVYGNPQTEYIMETHQLEPINSYGASKLMAEQLIQEYHQHQNLHYYTLRYFNACGADPESIIGETHNPETHLIPLAIQTALGLNPKLNIFGNNHATPDGTAVRDYIHVMDVCKAHLLALNKLLDSSAICGEYNLGVGKGYSVKEVIEAVEQITKRTVPVHMVSKREYEASSLMANNEKAKKELQWTPSTADLLDMVKHAYHWELKKIGQSILVS